MATLTYASTLEKGLDIYARNNFKLSHKQDYAQIFNVKSVGDNTRLSARYDFKDWGGTKMPVEITDDEDFTQFTFEDGYQSSITYKTYGYLIVLTENDIDDAIAGIKGPLAKIRSDILIGAHRLINYVAFGYLNNGATVSTTPDTKKLFATDHPCKTYYGNSATYSNYLTTSTYNDLAASSMELNSESLSAAKHHFEMNVRNYDGHSCLIKPKTLLVPICLEDQAARVTKSATISQNANSQYNTHKGLSYFATPYLQEYSTDYADSAWYLMGDKSDHGLTIVMRKRPTVKYHHDVLGRKHYYAVTMRLGVGATRAQGIVRCGR